MKTVYAGWDVAGWTCPATPQVGPGGESQDALVLLVEHDGKLAMLGVRLGNFGSSVLAGADFVREEASRLIQGSVDQFVLAIDAPLGWPAEFQNLLSWAWKAPGPDGYRSLLFRATDRLHCGQSSVVRSIGAASTKGMAFLQAQTFVKNPAQPGIFFRDLDRTIETYPRVIRNHALANPQGWFALEYSRLHPLLLETTADAEAALWCALVAAAFHLRCGHVLQSPPNAADAVAEGWIWAP